MKKKLFKLFLVFGVIVLSIFAFIGCEAKYENLIEDDERIEFIIDAYHFLPFKDPGIIVEGNIIVEEFPKKTLNWFYEFLLEDLDYRLIEYFISEKSKTLACYAPKKIVEEVFQIEIEDSFSEWCNTQTFYHIRSYMRKNKLSYQDVGLKFCYVDENDIKIRNGKDVLVYITEEIEGSSADGSLSIYSACEFEISEDGALNIEKVSYDYYGNKYLMRGKTCEKMLRITDFAYCYSLLIENENGVEVIREYLQEWQTLENLGAAYVELVRPAVISCEELEQNGRIYAYNYVYDYSKIKEIFSIE